MLANLSEQIRDCLERAEECARKAAVQADPGLRDDFLQLQKRWLALAQSMEFVERLDIFTKNSPKPNINSSQGRRKGERLVMPITPFLRGQAFDPETVEAMGKEAGAQLS